MTVPELVQQLAGIAALQSPRTLPRYANARDTFISETVCTVQGNFPDGRPIEVRYSTQHFHNPVKIARFSAYAIPSYPGQFGYMVSSSCPYYPHLGDPDFVFETKLEIWEGPTTEEKVDGLAVYTPKRRIPLPREIWPCPDAPTDSLLAEILEALKSQ